MLAVGVLCLLGAFGVVGYLMLAPTLVRLEPSRRGLAGGSEESALSSLGRRMASKVDRAVRQGSWTPVSALELEMAGVTMSIGNFLVTVAAATFATVVLLSAVLSSVLFGLLAGLFVPVIAKVVLSSRASKRRAAFGEQLDATVQLLASALRAGHSLPRALDTTARDSMSPTSEEVGRLINETRIGRDLVDAMHTTADRMQNEDFHWIAEAVAVQRETGGNLNEVLDRVGETIRERSALMREVHTLSAEGRASAKVLMVLPAAVALGQLAINPKYMAPLFQSTSGYIALGASVFLYTAGALWMRVIANVKI